MFRLFLIAVILAQLPAQQSGTVAGVLKDSEGKPIAGIRVAAVPRPDAVSDASALEAMSAIAETDSQGRYMLEGIPPGRYYIAAGRVDRRTYFPGTSDIAAAKDLLITAGQQVSEIDFVLSDASFGRETRHGSVPLIVSVEGGGPMPLSGNGEWTVIALASPERSLRSLPLFSGNSSVYMIGPPGTYKVVVENLPARYVVKSMTYRSIDLVTNALQFAPLDPTPRFPSPLLPVQALADLTTTANVGRYVPLTVTLASVPPQTKTGVRVSGRLDALGVEPQTIYLSNIPGDLFVDGTFEFWGVPPGRHSVATGNFDPNGVSFGGSVVVGDRNVGDVVLSELSLAPKLRQLPGPQSAGDRPAGSVPLAQITGSIVDEASGKPVAEGSVVIKSNYYYSDSFFADSDGRYKIPALLPGTYELEVQTFGYATITRTVELDDKDVTVDFSPRKLR